MALPATVCLGQPPGAVEPVAQHEARNVDAGPGTLAERHPEVPALEALAELPAGDLDQAVAADEGARADELVQVRDQPRVEHARPLPVGDDVAEGRDVAPGESSRRVGVEGVGESRKGALGNQIVGIEGEDVGSGRRCHAGHAGGRRAAVQAADDPHPALPERVQGRERRGVVRAVVHDHELARLLRVDGGDRVRERSAVVEARHYDRDPSRRADATKVHVTVLYTRLRTGLPLRSGPALLELLRVCRREGHPVPSAARVARGGHPGRSAQVPGRRPGPGGDAGRRGRRARGRRAAGRDRRGRGAARRRRARGGGRRSCTAAGGAARARALAGPRAQTGTRLGTDAPGRRSRPEGRAPARLQARAGRLLGRRQALVDAGRPARRARRAR